MVKYNKPKIPKRSTELKSIYNKFESIQKDAIKKKRSIKKKKIFF